MPFPTPRNRFDPLSGRFRLRYAANDPVVAVRERFPAKILTEADGDLWLIELRLTGSSLNLTHQGNLDALGLDDRISTGRIEIASRGHSDPLLDACGRLADCVHDWWPTPPAILYRSRTCPSTGRSVAFGESGFSDAIRVGRIGDAIGLMPALIRHGLLVPPSWLD